MCYIHSGGDIRAYQGKGVISRLFEYMVNCIEKEKSIVIKKGKKHF